MSSRHQRAPTQGRAPTIFEFERCTWFNGGEGVDIGALKRELPAVELGSGDDCLCAMWLGQMGAMCAGASERSRRVMVKFVLNEMIKQAVAEFCDNFEDWRTDADDVTTHELVRQLESWLTGIVHNQV
jgi:hypothetical protein